MSKSYLSTILCVSAMLNMDELNYSHPSHKLPSIKHNKYTKQRSIKCECGNEFKIQNKSQSKTYTCKKCGKSIYYGTY